MTFSDRQKDILLDRYGEYPVSAYEFVADATSACVASLEHPRHVTAAELVAFFRGYAVQEFGVMAPTVLKEWNLCTPSDVGTIVYRLIEMGVLSASEGDRKSDFDFSGALFTVPTRRRRRVSVPKID